MTRQQRRALERQENKNVTYTLNARDIQRIKEQAVKEACFESFKLLLLTSCLTLRDKFGFGNVRMERFVGNVIEMFINISENRLDYDDLKVTLKEEIGLDIDELSKSKYEKEF